MYGRLTSRGVFECNALERKRGHKRTMEYIGEGVYEESVRNRNLDDGAIREAGIRKRGLE